MEKEIVKILCSKYGKSERFIKLMIETTINDGCNLNETVNLINRFYDNKVCNKVCNRRIF